MWHDSAKSPVINLYISTVDATALFAFFVWAIHFSKATFLLAIIGIAFFAIVKHWGYTPFVFLRILRRRLAGPVKHTVSTRQMRRWARWS